MPEPSKPFVVETDASKFTSGGILQQQDMNGDWHPAVTYQSHSAKLNKTMRSTTKNYWQSSKHSQSGDTTCQGTPFSPNP